jgi:hypothetical protein
MTKFNPKTPVFWQEHCDKTRTVRTDFNSVMYFSEFSIKSKEKHLMEVWMSCGNTSGFWNIALLT